MLFGCSFLSPSTGGAVDKSKFGDMAELVDAADLGSVGFGPVGSIPTIPISPLFLFKLYMRLVKASSLLSTLYHSAVSYPSPANLTYLWNFGVYALLCLAVQIATGLFLAMHYVPEQGLAFISVEHIMRDVNAGWLLRYIHANGASMFFIVVYTHTFRGLYYSSYAYPRQMLWNVGVLILLLMIITAFLGYVLPWGQMSFWAATVITNLVSAVPRLGNAIVVWIWGGYSVDNATLNRFFSLHFFFPFIIAALVALHLILLHTHKSNNPLGVDLSKDTIPFYPYYIVKDVYGVVLFLIFFSLFLFFLPNVLGHPDNYIAANPMVTPAHIVPEWYFLPFYAILRAIPDKLMGVIALLLAILSLLALPYLARPEVRSGNFRPLSHLLFWFMLFNCLILGWLGSKPVEHPYVLLSQLSTLFYFAYFFILLPGVIALERFFWSNLSYLDSFGSSRSS
jgi:quinol-cytochrome oxidoreductase complex cytochrome b subunit